MDLRTFPRAILAYISALPSQEGNDVHNLIKELLTALLATNDLVKDTTVFDKDHTVRIGGRT